MHSEVAEATLLGKLNGLIVGLEDKHLLRGVATIYRVPETQPFLQQSARIKLETFVANVDEEALGAMFSAVLNIGFLRPHGMNRLAGLNRDTVAKLGAQTPPPILPELNERLVDLYWSSASFAQANLMAPAISNVAKQFNASTAERVLRAATNRQVRYSSGFGAVLESIKKSEALSSNEFSRLLTDLELAEEHADLLHAEDAPTVSAGPFRADSAGDSAQTIVSPQTGTSVPL